MLRIATITLREIALALKEPFQISSGTQSRRRIFLLELTSADGVAAWSECVAAELPNYSSETIDTCWHAIREWVAPRVLGRAFAGPEEVHPALELNFRGHHMAKAAVEMGAWELAARTEGISLSAKLGGTRYQIRVGISLGQQFQQAACFRRIDGHEQFDGPQTAQRVRRQRGHLQLLQQLLQTQPLLLGRAILQCPHNERHHLLPQP